MKHILPFMAAMLVCSCGDLSDECIQVKQVNLCYYPDQVTAVEANQAASILAEEGFGADCKLVSNTVLLADIEIKDRNKQEQLLKRLVNIVAAKLKRPFTIKVVTALEGKSSFSVQSDPLP